MIDVKRAFERMMSKYTYVVKVVQGYDDVSFEFETIEGASGFAQLCLEHLIPDEKDDATVTITLSKKVEEEPEEEKVEEKQDAKDEKEVTES